MTPRPPRTTRRRMLLALGVSLVTVLPGTLLFTSISEAATLSTGLVVATTISDVPPSSTVRTTPPSPPPCPTTGTPGWTPRPSGDAVPPTPPCRLTAFIEGGTGLTLLWGAATDNIAVTGYIVYDRYNGVTTERTTGGESTGIALSQLPTEQHVYWVRARDAIGNLSGPSNQVTVGGGTVVATADSTPPTAPSNLTVTVYNGGATLSWTASTDNVALAEYVVYDQYTDVIVMRNLPPNYTSFTFPTTAPATQHTWWVVAKDLAGNLSPSSNRVTIGTPPACPPPGQCTTAPTTPTTAPTCAVAYVIQSEWRGGFQASVEIRNTGTAPINGWNLSFSLPSGQTVGTLWGGVMVVGPGPAVTVRNQSWNGTIAPGGTAWFGFLGWGSASPAPKPTTFTLNGNPCTVA